MDKMPQLNDKLAKLIVTATVIVANYIFSKFWVFKKKGKGRE